MGFSGSSCTAEALDEESGAALFCTMRTLLPIALAVVAFRAPAQDTATAAPPGLAASKGAYSAAQADRGEKVFAKICVACHETFEFTGREFDKAWLGKTAFEFFDQVKTKMPDDNPGTLAREDVVDVLAYIFKLNAYPAGPADLPNDDEKLKQIQIDAKPTTPPPPSRARP
jgi:mono/diheme cytochrome c family protein